MSSIWRVAAFVIVLAGLGTGSYLLYRTQVAQPLGEAVAVARGNISATVAATGKVEPQSEVKLSFKMGGRLRKLHVVEGQQVKEGDLVAELETTTLELELQEAETTLALNQLKLQQVRRGTRREEIDIARAQLEAAQARLDDLRARPRPDEVATARAAFESASVAVQDAQAAYDKVRWEPNIGELPHARRLQLATIEFEAAKARYEKALQGPTPEKIRAVEQEAEAARSRLELAQSGPLPEETAILERQVELARIGLERARSQLEDARLVSPLSGTVLTAPIKVGEFASPQQVVMTLGNLEALQIRADIDEVDVGKVAEGQQVSVTFDAFPGERVRGKIIEILPEAKVKAGATVYEARVQFSSRLPVRPRMAADLTITLGTKEGALLVPNRAVETVGRKKVVDVLEGDRVVRRTVEVGVSNDTHSEILEGLKEGEVLLIR